MPTKFKLLIVGVVQLSELINLFEMISPLFKEMELHIMEYRSNKLNYNYEINKDTNFKNGMPANGSDKKRFIIHRVDFVFDPLNEKIEEIEPSAILICKTSKLTDWVKYKWISIATAASVPVYAWLLSFVGSLIPLKKQYRGIKKQTDDSIKLPVKGDCIQKFAAGDRFLKRDKVDTDNGGDEDENLIFPMTDWSIYVLM
jgi:hypothetical protein